MLSTNESVIVVTDEAIFPTNSGGRLAALNDIIALTSCGYRVTVISLLKSTELNDDLRRQYEVAFEDSYLVCRRGFISSTVRFPGLPYCASRALPSKRLLRPLGCSFQSLLDSAPVAIIASHDWMTPFAKHLGNAHRIPVVLRSHNDEIRYLSVAGRASPRVKRRLFLLSESLRLRLAFRRIVSQAQAVALLSELDAPVYSRIQRGPAFPPCFIIPPVFTEGRDAVRDPSTVDRSGLLFIGALDIPQTATGIAWFVRSVMPIISQCLPQATLTVAGRRADHELIQLMNSVENVQFLGEVERTDVLVDSARIFVNPVFQGSGVNMKLGEPAARGLPIVSTPFGVRGLDDLAKTVSIGGNAKEMASACIQLLLDDDYWLEQSRKARDCVAEHYSPGAVGRKWEMELSRLTTRGTVGAK